MKTKLLIAAMLCALPAWSWAQVHVHYYPSTGTGTGDADPTQFSSADSTVAVAGAVGAVTLAAKSDPAQFSSPGGDIVVGGIVGAVTLDLDGSDIPRFSVGAASKPATGTQGHFYWENDAFHLTGYPATDTPIQFFADNDTIPLANGGTGITTAADDTVLNSNGSAWSAKAVPDCDDTAGSHLNYDTTTNAFSCGTSGDGTGGSASTTSATFLDDFGGAGGTTGIIGSLGWGLLGVVSGGSAAIFGATPNHPGVYRLSSGLTDNAGEWIYGENWSATDLGAENWEAYFVIRPEDAVTSTYLSVGFVVGTPNASTGAIRAFYDTDLAHATWIFQVCDSSTSGCQSAGDDTNSNTVGSTATPTANTWQSLRMRGCQTCGPAGVAMIDMSIGTAGAYETAKTFCSSGCDNTLANLVTGDGTFLRPTYMLLARVGSANKDLDIDYYQMVVTSGLVRF